MRLPDSGRAAHPKLRGSSLRHYTLDDTAPGGSSDRAFGTLVSQPGSTLPVVNSTTGMARRIKSSYTAGMTESSTDTVLQTAARGAFTIGCLVRLMAQPGGDLTLAYLGGSTGTGTAANNQLVVIGYGPDRKPWFYHEHSTRTGIIRRATTYDLPIGKWVYLQWRKSAVTGVGPGGTCTLELIVNGHVVETFTGATNCSDGTSAILRIGCQFSGAGYFQVPEVDIDGLYFWSEALPDADVWDDQRRLHLLSFFSRVDVKVDLESLIANVFDDMTDFAGHDWVEKVELPEETDQPCATATVHLFREIENLSLASLKTDTKANLTDPFNPTSYAARVKPAKRIEVWLGRVPLGIRATGRDWQSRFKGIVDEVDEAQSDSIVLHCRDDGGVLVDTYIEETLVYGNESPILPVQDEMQWILNDNDANVSNNSIPGDATHVANNPGIAALVARVGSYSPITLYTPTSPSWSLKKWGQRREGVLPALRTLAGQIGWECRYRFDQNPNQNQWRLTFYDPDREREDVDTVLLADDVIDISDHGQSALGIRNVVRVVYPSDETTLPLTPTVVDGITLAPNYFARSGWNNIDGEGGRMTAYVEIESNASIAEYQRRWFMELGEASTSQISTIAEAARMAFGSLRDLERAPLHQTIRIPCLFELEANDILKIGPNTRLHTAAQRLAAYSVTHTIDEQATTSISMRGKPTVGFKRWLRLETRAGNARPGVMRPQDANADVYQGQLLQVMRNLVDRTNAFRGGKFVQMRNPAFQSFSNGRNNFPDDWSTYYDTADPNRAGATWGSSGTDSHFWVADSVTGSRSLLIRQKPTAMALITGFIPIDGSRYTVYSVQVIWKRAAATTDGLQIEFEFFDRNKVFINRYASGTINDNGSSASGVWFTETRAGLATPQAPLAEAAFVRISVRRNLGGSAQDIYVDSVNVFRTANQLSEQRVSSVQSISAPGGGYERWTNLDWNNTLPSPQTAGDHVQVKGWGAGDGIGRGFIAREDGFYQVTVHVAAHTGSANRRFAIRLMKNATYGTNGNYKTGTGSVLIVGDAMELVAKADLGQGGANLLSNLGFATLTAGIQLVKGDVISVDWFSQQAVIVIPSDSTSYVLNGTYWVVKLKLAE